MRPPRLKTTTLSAAVALFLSAAERSAAYNSITTPVADEVVPPGINYTIKWTADPPGQGQVSLSILQWGRRMDTSSYVQVGEEQQLGISDSDDLSYVWHVTSTPNETAWYSVGMHVPGKYDSYTPLFRIGPPSTPTNTSSQPSSTTNLPSSISSSSTGTKPASESTGTPNSEANPPASDDRSSGLSKGATAGIAVGTIVAVAILGVLLFLVFHYRKKAIRGRAGGDPAPGKAELDGAAAGPALGKKAAVGEMDGEGAPGELQAPVEAPPVELDASAGTRKSDSGEGERNLA